MSVYDLETTSTKQTLQQTKDATTLEQFGYKQELKRKMGFWSMLGFSYTLLNSWSVMAGSLASVMLNGGPAVLIWGWIGACTLSIFVALCMADLCSAYPVAGGQYSWCLLLAKNTRWGRAISFACGWIQMGGLVAMVSVSFYLPSNNICALASLNYPDYVMQDWQVALMGICCALIACLVTMFGNSILPLFSKASMWWNVCSFIICTVVILARAPTFQPASFVFTHTISGEGWPGLNMSIVVGLMQCAYGISTYDSVAHMSEETEDAAKQCPRAILMCVLVALVTCLVFMLALCFVIQDLDAVINTPTGYPLLEIFRQATQNDDAATCLGVAVLGTQIFALFSMATETSRSVYAFARDGAFPWKTSKYLMMVSQRFDVPWVALIFVVAVAAGLVCILFGSPTAYFTVLSIATVGLYVSYLFCIGVYMIRREHKLQGYYNLGRWALWAQIPACLYLVFCVIFMYFPTTIPVTGNNMNYSCVATGIIIILALISWFGGAHKTYIHTVDNLESAGVIEAVDADAVFEQRSDEKK